MKNYLLFIILLIFSIQLFGTDVSGNQSGTWDMQGSPYLIVGEITVPNNETLNISAGVEVIAMGSYKITAFGNIIAMGAINDTIRFYGDNGIDWGGIRLEDEINASNFAFCRISNTDDMNDYAIHSVNSPVYIHDCFFDDHQKAISFSGMSSNDPSYMEIKNSIITNIEKSGITIVDNSNALIDSCEVTQCGLGTSFYGAIQLSLQSNSHSCNPIIANNYIHHNGKQGITMANLFGYDNMAPLVKNNEVSYNYTGIYLYGGQGFYQRNHVHHNFVENNADSGAGFMLYGSSAEGIFTYNEIHHNYAGFYLASGAMANLGNLNNTEPTDDGFNCIYDNIFFDGNEFSVYNTSSEDIIAQNCVWDDDPPLDETIIDGNDNASYGIVDYEPILSPFAPPDSISVDLQNFIIFPGAPAYPTYALRDGFNIYRDAVLIATGVTAPYYIFTPIYGVETNYGFSFVYSDPLGESSITDTTIFLPHVLNPPQNLQYQIIADHVNFHWQEPAAGSSSSFIEYKLALDDEIYSTTNLFYDVYGLQNGTNYVASLWAEYAAGASDTLSVNFVYTGTEAQIRLAETKILRNYPNPFNPVTTIIFNVPQNTDFVKLDIYNIKGQKVIGLVDTELPPGHHKVTWNGKDDNGKSVGSGLYFYKLITADQKISKKMLLLR